MRGLQAEQLRKVERWALLDAADLAAALRQYPPPAGVEGGAGLARLPHSVWGRPNAGGWGSAAGKVPLLPLLPLLLHARTASRGAHLPAPAPTPPTLAAAEATSRIAQLAAARRLLNLHKAQAALHADEDFQADVRQVRGCGWAGSEVCVCVCVCVWCWLRAKMGVPQHCSTGQEGGAAQAALSASSCPSHLPACLPARSPPHSRPRPLLLQAHVREAIDAIRADTSKWDRYAADPQILAVLQVCNCTADVPLVHRRCPAETTRPTRPLMPALLKLCFSLACVYLALGLTLLSSCPLPLPLPHRGHPPQKMRRLHGVAQANGQRTVDIESMLAQVGRLGSSGSGGEESAGG